MTNPATEKRWQITATVDTALCVGDSVRVKQVPTGRRLRAAMGNSISRLRRSKVSGDTLVRRSREVKTTAFVEARVLRICVRNVKRLTLNPRPMNTALSARFSDPRKWFHESLSTI